MENYIYSKKVIEHFSNPRRCRCMPDADGRGIAVAPGCGDTIWIYIKVKGLHIADSSFQAHGCPCAIACASLLTGLALGKHVDDAAEILDEHLALKLDMLEDKKDCSAIAASALHEAIYDYVFRYEERKAGSDAKG